MFSMTGYGRGEYKEGGIELSVEVKTVNNRYLDISVKCPKIFIALEEVIRSAVRKSLTRGHADVFINLTDKREKPKTLTVDGAAAKAYCMAAMELNNLFPDMEDDFTLTSLMRYPDVIKQEESGCADDELIAALNSALEGALQNLNVMRKKEGAKLKADMLGRMDTIQSLVAKITERAPLVTEDYRVKLEEKVKKYLDGLEMDEGKLLTEVALFADKSNIDEELTRLNSHIEQFRDICAAEVVGRKLDFLVQEFNREANTICSKSNDIIITRHALDLKNEIEKVREQVQNVE